MRSMLQGLTAVLVLAAAPVALAAERLPPEAQLAKLLDGRTAGAPVDCINQRLIASSQIIDKTAIVYRMPGGALYVNRPNGAEALDRDAILVSKTIGDQLCRMDIVTVLDSGSHFMRGSVSVGTFIPYARPRR